MPADGCLCFLHLSGSGQEADDFSCCDACIMNQRAQWPTCDQQRCTLLWVRGALSSPLSPSTDSTQLRGRPASMGIHVAKSQSISERRKQRLCSLPPSHLRTPRKNSLSGSEIGANQLCTNVWSLRFLGNSAVVLYRETSFHHSFWKHWKILDVPCWVLFGKAPWFCFGACTWTISLPSLIWVISKWSWHLSIMKQVPWLKWNFVSRFCPLQGHRTTPKVAPKESEQTFLEGPFRKVVKLYIISFNNNI